MKGAGAVTALEQYYHTQTPNIPFISTATALGPAFLFLALKSPCSAEQITTRLLSFHFPLLQFVYPYTLVGLFRFRIFILPRHHLPGMRRDVQEIFCATPHHKRVMMFSATLANPGNVQNVHG
jgi:hypothetical protein